MITGNRKWQLIGIGSIGTFVLVMIFVISSYFAPQDPGVESRFRQLSSEEQNKIINETVERHGAVYAWDFLKSVYYTTSNGGVYDLWAVHPLAHLIGTKLYEESGIEGARFCDSSFEYACYHQIVTHALAVSGPQGLDAVKAICGHLGPVGVKIAGCIHGVGHGLSEFENMNTQKALWDCDRLDLGKIEVYCWEGVIMDTWLNPRGTNFQTNNLFWCNTLDERYRPRCARVAALVLSQRLSRQEQNTQHIAKNCQRFNNQEMTEQCIYGIGQSAAISSLGDLATIRRECGTMAIIPNARELCLAAAARRVIIIDYPRAYQKALSLCSELEGKQYEECLADIQEVKNLYRDEVETPRE